MQFLLSKKTLHIIEVRSSDLREAGATDTQRPNHERRSVNSFDFIEENKMRFGRWIGPQPYLPSLANSYVISYRLRSMFQSMYSQRSEKNLLHPLCFSY